MSSPDCSNLDMLAELCTQRLHEEEATPPTTVATAECSQEAKKLAHVQLPSATSASPSARRAHIFRLHLHVRSTGTMPISTHRAAHLWSDRNFSGSNALSSSARSPATSRSCPSPSSSGSSVQRSQSWVEEHVRLRGSPPHELGEKKIKNSDTDTNQSRPLIPKNMLERILDYATEPERQSIHTPGGLLVNVLDSVGRRYRMMCKFRSSQKGFVFNGPGWNDFVGDNSLKCGHKLCVMAFRANYEGDLCFAFL